MNRAVYVVGDTHGNWKPLKYKIKSFDMSDCTIINVGDIGLGFKSYNRQEEELVGVNEFFKERGIELFGIRGNHDDPHFFDGGYSFSNMEFLQDYAVRTFNDKIFQFIGGAVSVDRMHRREGESYWKDEKFNFDPNKCVKCDVLITHSTPSWNGPTDKAPISNWLMVDKDLWPELQQERADHDKVIELCKPSRHYCGHFHLNETAEHNGCRSRILDIDELLEITHH